MSKEVVSADAAPEAIGPYSQAIKADGFVFASGQIALDPDTGEMVSGGVQPETERVLENIKAVLAAAGTSLEKVVQSTVYLADMAEFPAMNEIYARYFPARLSVPLTSREMFALWRRMSMTVAMMAKMRTYLSEPNRSRGRRNAATSKTAAALIEARDT